MNEEKLKSLLKQQRKKIIELNTINENLNQKVKELQQEKNIKTLLKLEDSEVPTCPINAHLLPNGYTYLKL